jgi:hypothetical protein
LQEEPSGDVGVIADEQGAFGIEETVNLAPVNMETLVLPQMATNFLNRAAGIEANYLNELFE